MDSADTFTSPLCWSISRISIVMLLRIVLFFLLFRTQDFRRAANANINLGCFSNADKGNNNRKKKKQNYSWCTSLIVRGTWTDQIPASVYLSTASFRIKSPSLFVRDTWNPSTVNERHLSACRTHCWLVLLADRMCESPLKKKKKKNPIQSHRI